MVMKKLKSFLFVLSTTFVYSQNCPSIGPDQYLACNVESTTLTANLDQCGPPNNPYQTTDYSVTDIPYTPQLNAGTQISLFDDAQQGPFDIGFTFCFFGQTYTQFYIGSNGWISFSADQPTTFSSVSIPSTLNGVPRNCIMGPWQDWHPGVGGQIKYQTQGVAPHRKLVVSWIDMPMYVCLNLQGTFHIVIYESTNIIENYIQNKPNCTSWSGGTAVQGLHNDDGTFAVTVPNRNSTQWVTNNDAKRYTPSGPEIFPTLTWYVVGNPNPIGTGNTINVTPPQNGEYYTCHLTYPSCNDSWNLYYSNLNSGPDTVFVKPASPFSIPPIQALDTIYNYPTSELYFINDNGNNYTYTWTTLGSIISGQGNDSIYINWDNHPLGYIPQGVSVIATNADGCESLPQYFNLVILTIDSIPQNTQTQELIFIPNAFTPNGDEINQVWKPIFTEGYDPQNFNLMVVNRWGQVIWESNNASIGWDGTYLNKMCPDGVYFWKTQFGNFENADIKVLTGHLTLIR